ncbi:MAG: hypothetical protein U0271_46935 [Polyangiaceae bacterium]
MTRLRKKLVPTFGVAVFSVAWVINPALFSGCAGSSTNFGFGEAEAVGLVGVASHSGPYVSADGALELQLELDQSAGEDKQSDAGSFLSPTREAHACGGRTFMRSAGACVDVTSVPVEGWITLKDVKTGATLVDHERASGALMIFGASLDNATVDLHGGGYAFDLSSSNGHTFQLRGVSKTAG